MKKISLVVLSILALASCNTKPKESIEIPDIFYKELVPGGMIIHADKKCAGKKCTYVNGWFLDDYLSNNNMCAKCISLEMYRELERY